MSIPGFNAESTLGPSFRKYRSQKMYGSFRSDSLSLQQYDMEEIDDLDDLDDDEMDEDELEEALAEAAEDEI